MLSNLLIPFQYEYMVKAILVLFNMKGMDVIVALSAMSVLWPIGDCLPPTAVVGRASVMELDYKGRYFGEFVVACMDAQDNPGNRRLQKLV